MEDSEDAIFILRASITQLCVADHQNRADLLAPWLVNKTVATFEEWLEDPERILLVAEQDGALLGVGMATRSGEIMLNYVAPDRRFEGVSSRMLKSLEKTLLEQGKTELNLLSTKTAHAFYLTRGWANSGQPLEDAGMVSFPMTKRI